MTDARTSSEFVTGECKWFSVNKGYGFIKSKDGEDVFVHMSALQGGNSNQQKSLMEGEMVEFQICVDKDGRKRAVSVQGVGGAELSSRPPTFGRGDGMRPRYPQAGSGYGGGYGGGYAGGGGQYRGYPGQAHQGGGYMQSGFPNNGYGNPYTGKSQEPAFDGNPRYNNTGQDFPPFNQQQHQQQQPMSFGRGYGGRGRGGGPRPQTFG